MLEVRNLYIKKISEDRELIKNLSFTLNKGDKFAVIGIEGSGKSTLLKTILNQDLDYVEHKGSIDYKRNRVGYLPQSLNQDFKEELVLDYLLKNSIDSEITNDEYAMLSKLDRLLRYVKFQGSFDESKTMNQFSGGELVKLGLVKILLRDPDILLFDEPTNDLDLETILFLEEFIQTEERPILYISHDVRLLENTSNGIIHLSQVKKFQSARTYFEKMNYKAYIDAFHIALDTKEMIAKKQRAEHKKKVERFNQVFNKVEHQQNQAVRNPSLARLLAKKMKSLKSQEKRFEREQSDYLEIPEREEEINIFFEDGIKIPNNRIIVDYRNKELKINDLLLSNNVELFVKGPSKVCILGMNGTGKTTLLKDIYKQIKDKPNLSVGYMSQNYDELLSNGTALEFLLEGRISSMEGMIRKYMGALHFTREEMLYDVRSLSGGQKAKLLLLKMVLDNNNVLILDEPTRNLSPLSIPSIHSLLIHFKGCIISVSHDRAFIENVMDDIYELSKTGLVNTPPLN